MAARSSKPQRSSVTKADRPRGTARPPDDLPGRAAVEAIIKLLHEHDLAELELEREGFRIRVRRDMAGVITAPAAERPSGLAPELGGDMMAAAAIPDSAGKVVVKSPIVGTFYRSASPDADPYVEEGDPVKKGQVLCIVEAMKLMNEIESEVDGRIIKILVESTKPVEYGQPLFLIEPSPASA